MELKQPITYAEQVDKLVSYGFLVDDRDKLISFLEQANYYRLSAYLLPFKKFNGSFQQGIPLLRIKALYDFDAELRNWLSKSIETIEYYMRTQFSYYIGHKYGADAYLLRSLFNHRHKHDIFLKRIENCIKQNENTLVVKHHEEKYGGKFPIWVIIEFFSTGMLSFFYSDLKNEDQKSIAENSFNIGYKQLSSWLRCFTELRNKCAHFTRLYYWQFTATPKNIPQDNQIDRWTMDSTLFSQIYMLKKMYPNHEEWNTINLPRLIAIIQHHDININLEHIGFPDNWIDLLNCYS